jgi:hypothetical protein
MHATTTIFNLANDGRGRHDPTVKPAHGATSETVWLRAGRKAATEGRGRGQIGDGSRTQTTQHHQCPRRDRTDLPRSLLTER